MHMKLFVNGIICSILSPLNHLHTWFSYQCIHGCPIKVFWNWSISQKGGLFYHALQWSISRGIKPNQTLLLQLKTKWHCRNLGWNLKTKYHICNTICNVLCNTRDGWQPINSRAWCNNDATGRCVVKSSKSLEDCGPGKTSRLCTCQTRQLLLIFVELTSSNNAFYRLLQQQLGCQVCRMACFLPDISFWEGRTMAWSGGHISWTNFICTKKKRGNAITHKDNKACCDPCWLFLSDGRWHDLERWHDPLVITLHLWKMYDCSQNSETQFWSVTAVLKQSKNQSNDLQNYYFGWLLHENHQFFWGFLEEPELQVVWFWKFSKNWNLEVIWFWMFLKNWNWRFFDFQIFWKPELEVIKKEQISTQHWLRHWDSHCMHWGKKVTENISLLNIEKSSYSIIH